MISIILTQSISTAHFVSLTSRSVDLKVSKLYFESTHDNRGYATFMIPCILYSDILK